MAQEIINIGAAPNDGTGDDLRSGATKINNNFSELYSYISSGKFKIIESISDLPTPVSDVITLEADTSYMFINDLDLSGNRLVGASNTAILGTSSETSRLTSTGLGAGVALFSTNWTTPIQNIAFYDVDTALDIDGTGNNAAIDWDKFNIVNVPNIGTVDTVENWILTNSAFLNSKGLVFTGTIGTIGIANSLFTGDGAVGNIIELDASCVITRRFRPIYSSFVAFGSTVGIDVDVSATIPTESYILDTVNFSGGGTYLTGVDETSNKSLFVNCVGIVNTAVNGQLYMQNNATATTIAATNTFYKVSGTTTPSADNSKFLHSDNRLTCDATIERKYLIQASLSFSAGNNNICEFGFYDSKLGGIRTPSRIKSTANGAGRQEGVTFFCVVQYSQGDYLEIHCANTTSTTNITVTDLNFTITEIK